MKKYILIGSFLVIHGNFLSAADKRMSINHITEQSPYDLEYTEKDIHALRIEILRATAPEAYTTFLENEVEYFQQKTINALTALFRTLKNDVQLQQRIVTLAENVRGCQSLQRAVHISHPKSKPKTKRE
ncbi:MAG TPA: hypothetical protein VEK38_02540 [Candidatus Bathyarchaeia archaeon]|nr:hypothetical protein [Candidatus Bathyarchaeia archaeon]